MRAEIMAEKMNYRGTGLEGFSKFARWHGVRI
jgi:hypothetical protein